MTGVQTCALPIYFEKLMRKQLELDAARLKAQEDLLREACRSQAEEYDDGYEED